VKDFLLKTLALCRDDGVGHLLQSYTDVYLMKKRAERNIVLYEQELNEILGKSCHIKNPGRIDDFPSQNLNLRENMGFSAKLKLSLFRRAGLPRK
jgi:hypothetical protein